MKVYVLIWLDYKKYEVEGVTSDKSLAVKWNQSGRNNDFIELDLIEKETDYFKWLAEE